MSRWRERRHETTLPRHCERSEAIHCLSKKDGLLRRCAPRNDGLSGAWQVCITRRQNLSSSFVSYSSSRRSKSQSPVAPKALRIESRL